MRTQSQIEASRANGAKSRGPITPEGKAISAQNAVRHGILCSRTVVIKGESEERFQQHLKAFLDEFQPQGPLELALVEKMAVSRWRQISILGLETAAISNAVAELHENDPDMMDQKDPAVRAFLAIGEVAAKGRTLDICSRYSARFDREFDRAINRLLAVRRVKNVNLPDEPVN